MLKKVKDYIYLKILHFKYTYMYYFAHHPLCKTYKNHTYKVFGMYICKGCFHTYSAFASTSIITLILLLSNVEFISRLYSSFYGLFLELFFLIPLLIDFFHIKTPRKFKNIFRRMLGYSITTALFQIALSPWWVKLTAFGIMVIAYIKLRSARKSKNASRCVGCKEENGVGVCSGFKLVVDQEKKFSREATEYIMKSKSGQLN